MSPPPGQGERVHHRPCPGVEVEAIEITQHGLGMRGSHRRVLGAGWGFSCHWVRAVGDGDDQACIVRKPVAAAAPVRDGGLRADLYPSAKVTGLGHGGLVPGHLDGPEEPEPPEQVHPVGALCRDGPAHCLEIVQVLADRVDNGPVGADDPVRLPEVARVLEPAHSSDDESHEVPLVTPCPSHGRQP